MTESLTIIITKNETGFVVYDYDFDDKIDVFPDTDEGFTRLLEFLKEELTMVREEER